MQCAAFDTLGSELPFAARRVDNRAAVKVAIDGDQGNTAALGYGPIMQSDSKLSGLFTVFCIGACLGTLTSATIFVAASVLILFIAPVLLVPYAAWGLWTVAMRSRGRFRSISPILAVVVTVVGVPVCGYLPYGMASLELILRSDSIPDRADVEVSRVTPDPFGNSTTGPGIIYDLDPQGDVLAALTGLEEQLIAEGWRLVAGGVPRARGSNVSVLLGRETGRTLGLYATWNRTQHSYENIAIRQHFSPLTPPIFLFAQIAAGAISLAYARYGIRNRENGDEV